MLEIKNLSKSIAGASIINSVDFIVKPGQIVALIGPNGAGKTTTMKLIMGLMNPSKGDIKVSNQSIIEQKTNYLKNVAYVPDTPFFYEELTGIEFLTFTSELWDQAKKEEEDSYLINKLAMEDFIDSPIHTYSYGMKRKLSLLISLTHQPKYLIMDEPFNGLDPTSTYNIKAFLKEYVDKNNGVLISSHMMESVESLCTHVALINQGNLIIFEELQQLKKQYQGKTLEEIFIESV